MLPPDTQYEESAVAESEEKVAEPPLFKVLLHNDDYTTREFVVLILQAIFSKSETEATQIMLHVHNNGVGVAGIYSFEIAETKVTKTVQLARSHEYPLQLSIEPSE